jgi:N-acetylgalactosamine kinase
VATVDAIGSVVLWFGGFKMSARAPKFSIILAGGKGTRMRSANRHKVCFAIDGQPAINRALDVYKACGIQQHIVVVGAMAGQVIETVGREHEGILYAYQDEQLGTAHATRQGARVLQALGVEQEVLIVAGDRVVEPMVLEQLFDLFYSQHCDLAFLVGPKRRRSDPGRVLLYPDGSVLGNVEVWDVWQRQAFRAIRTAAAQGQPLSRDDILALIREDFDERRAAVAFGELWQAVALEGRNPTAQQILDWIPPDKMSFAFVDQQGASLQMLAEEVDRADLANFSTYLVKTTALHYALAHLDRDNAQREEYLSDMITLLAQARHEGRPRFRVRALRVDNPNYVMAFNDPAELLEIEAYVQSKRRRAMHEPPSGPALRTIAEWQQSFNRNRSGSASDAGGQEDDPLWAELVSVYSADPELIWERVRAYRATLGHAERLLGPDAQVLIVRSPGRVNLMGRHVDHQGGHCNLMTIGYETVMVVHPRQDDRVHLYNLAQERFPDRAFSIGDLLIDLPWDDWMSLVNSDRVCAMAVEAGGDWAQYVKAAVLRLQKKFATLRLRGIDVIVHGNIPVAAGLSSSSALVVATAEAMIAVNQLDIFPAQFVDLCGEGEWFVGTRGGSADHAAIKLGEKGKVVQVTFFPFAVQETVPFPEDYVLAVCDSGVKAHKTTNARDQFNHRVACYRIGLKLIRALYPQYAPLLHHLRDVNTRTLGVPLSWIYRILLRLPEQATREQLYEVLPDDGPDDDFPLEALFATHHPPQDGLYPIRSVVLYGLAECERSRLFAEALKANRIDEIGQLMNVSHDGDRVAWLREDGTQALYRAPASNSYLLDLIEDLESEEPARVIRAQLEQQPGGYHCSVPEIDFMVDVALRTEGVVGAQLAGAGLGGCMMVLARKEAVPRLIENLTARYYGPSDKLPAILLCKPIAGSSVLLMNGESSHKGASFR